MWGWAGGGGLSNPVKNIYIIHIHENELALNSTPLPVTQAMSLSISRKRPSVTGMFSAEAPSWRSSGPRPARPAHVPSRLMSRLRLANLSYAQLFEFAVDAL